MTTKTRTFLNQKVIGIAGVIVAVAAILVTIIMNRGPEPDFSISVNPIEASLQQGGKIPAIINVIGLHEYSHAVYLSATSKNVGIVSSFDPQSGKAKPSFVSTMTVDVRSNVEPNQYVLIVKAVGADGKEHTCNYNLAVTPSQRFTPTDATALFYPSGFMGDHEDIHIDDNFSKNTHSGNSCIKIHYSARGSHKKGWAGIYWQYPDGNWGDSPEARNLVGATTLFFWARGEKGGEKVEFKVGGINGTYKDSMGGPFSTSVVTLSTEWSQLRIDLSNKDLSHVIGGFCWVASSSLNPKGCTIYIDDITYE